MACRTTPRWCSSATPIATIRPTSPCATSMRSAMPMCGASQGGLHAWRSAGLPIHQGADTLPDARCIDYLFFVHDRHDGNKAAARQYLAWETGLIAQLDAQELATFHFPPID